MIPQFPDFKPIELSDKEEVEKLTKQFPPYSDFNFVSMWSWDIQGEMRFAQLNGNLVVRFTDYITRKPFYSFLGHNMPNETAKTLLDYAEEHGMPEMLKLVPEDSVRDLDPKVFLIEEDHNNHDYIIPTEIFKDYATKKTRTKKNSVKQFLKRFMPHTVHLDLSDPKVKETVYGLFTKWSEGKEDPLEVQNELHALKRFIENKQGEKDHVCTGVYVEDKLIGFCLSEKLNSHYSNIHFCKADTSISPGVYAYILQENAKTLHENGHKYVNIEQDLGIDNIKKWKMSHGSNLFLKKYIVRYNTHVEKLAKL